MSRSGKLGLTLNLSANELAGYDDEAHQKVGSFQSAFADFVKVAQHFNAGQRFGGHFVGHEFIPFRPKLLARW